MKVESPSDVSMVENTTPAVSPIKICMHALGTARNDVRAMRAATALVDAGFTVSIIDIESVGINILEEDIDGVHVKHMAVPRSFGATRFRHWSLVRAVWLFIRSLLSLIRTPTDIYHALDLPALPACYVAARLHRKPLIFESYELPFSMLSLSDMTPSRRRLQAFLTPLINHIMPRCAGVIAVSQPIVEEMQKRYRTSRVSLVRNIPAYRTVQKGKDLRQLLGLGPEVRIALYHGCLQPDRGLNRLIRAAPFLQRDIVIVMMGKNMAGTQAQLEALIASEGVADRVKIIPPVPYNDLLDWTASADIGLIVYDADYALNVQMMLPNKLFECLMAGLPVLSSQLDAVADIIRTYDVGQVVTSLVPEDIGAAINAMLADCDALARMHRNALNVAEKELNWEKERQKLILLYRGVLVKR